MIAVDGIEVKRMRFPDGTTQVYFSDEEVDGKSNASEIRRAVSFGKELRIVWRFEEESEWIALMQLRTLLEEMQATSRGNSMDRLKFHLYMPFLPYGRQDKEVKNGDCFALYTFAEMLMNNRYKWDSVTTLDAHSHALYNYIQDMEDDYILEREGHDSEVEPPVSLAGYTDKFPEDRIAFALGALMPDMVAYPDSGAHKRYFGNMALLERYSYVVGEKVREKDGTISSYKLMDHPKVMVKGRSVLMIDDICDGGRTFIELAKLLKEEGATEVNLYITHGIFSKGLQPLLDAGIKYIYDRDGQVKTP